jgi:multidrug efflux pump subunit AcrA (membrane-fusion protein)
MNSEIDITRFGSSGAASPTESAAHRLVSPPRRIFSRYFLPLFLLAGFAGVTAYAFRGAFIQTIDVTVTMPVAAPEKLLAQADFSSEPALAGSTPPGSGHSAAMAMQHGDKPGATPSGETRAERPPTTGRGKSLFQAPGWIEPSPYPIVIPALRPGTIESLNVIEGQEVTSGAEVAHLIDEDAQLAVKMHESTLRLKQAKYDAALNRWKNPTSLVEAVGTARAKGNQLTAQARRQRDLMELAGLEARVGNTLTKSGYEPSLETVRKETELSASRNQLLETHAEIALNSATLAAASERMQLRIEDREALEIAEAELLEAKVALATAQLALERSAIVAPTSGTIMRLNVSPGSMLSGEMAEGMTVAQMYKPDMLQVRVDVPLAEAAKVRPGLAAEIRVEALPDRRFRGELINIVPQFDLQKNVLPVKVRIYNPDQALRPEMIARVEFFADQPVAPASPGKPVPASDVAESSVAAKLSQAQAGAADDASSKTLDATADLLVIPGSSIRTAGNRKQVMIVGPDNTAYQKQITAVAVSDGLALVRDGLRITDKIIVSPSQVPSGRAVHIKEIVENGTH